MRHGNKAVFLSRLQIWAETPSTNKSVSRPLRQFLLWFFEQDRLPDPKYTPFLHDVPWYLVEAFELFRTSTEPRILAWRQAYLAIRNEDEVPDLLSVEFGGTSRWLFVDAVCREFAELVGDPAFELDLRSLLQAQDHLLQQTIARFSILVYRRGLYDRYAESTLRGMNGRFGQTELRAWASAGRIMLTFARPRAEGEIEHSVSFVGEDDKPLTGFGLQSCHTDILTAVGMINDCIAAWPAGVDDQRQAFKGNEKVKLDVVAAMEASQG